MWVRIQEISFAVAQASSVVDELRAGAVVLYEGEGYRGFRLLMDEPRGRALEVSYWDSEQACRACPDNPARGAGRYSVVVTNHYELAIDAA